MLNPISCPACAAANSRLSVRCNNCGEALAPEFSQPEDLAPPAPGLAPSTPAARPRHDPDSSLASFPGPVDLAGTTASRALAIAWLARHSTCFLSSGALAVSLAQLGLTSSLDVNEKAPLGFLCLLALGVALFAAGSFGLWMKRAAGDGPASDTIASDHRPDFPAISLLGIAGIVAGTVAAALLFVALAAGSTTGFLLIPWLLALVAFSFPLVPSLTQTATRLNARVMELGRRYFLDSLVVVGFLTLFIAMAVADLEHWYYSAIGDEFIFFEHARRIAEEGITRPFSQEGVYDKYPVMASVFQAMVMRVFGADNFGWTLSEALFAAASIPGIYILGHTLGGRKAAVFSVALFACSHYILAQSHVGYANLSPLPVAVWSITLFVMGWRRGNPLLLYAAGVIAGLGFYTHYSGRVVLPVIFLFALASWRPKRLVDLWPLAFGFALTVAPTFIVEQERVVTRMFAEVVGGYSEVVTGSPLSRVLSNIELNLPAFNFNSSVHTYVYGSLLDPVSAVIAVLGVAYALGHFRLRQFRLLLLWFGVAMVVTGLLSPYPHVAITRLTFAVPPLVLLAGVSMAHIVDYIQSSWRNNQWPRLRGAAASVLLLLLPLIFALNLWQFWQLTPAVYSHTPEALAVGVIGSPPCYGDISGTAIVGPAVDEGSLIRQALDSFYPGGPWWQGLDHAQVEAGLPLPDLPLRCIVFLDPAAPAARALQEQLARQYPDGLLFTHDNPSGSTRVQVFATGIP